MEQKKEKINLYVLGFIFLLVIGIIWNSLSVYILNKAEYDVDNTDKDSEDYAYRLSRLNQTKRDSRINNFIGNSAIIFGFVIFIIGFYIDMNKKYKSLETKLNNKMDQNNLKKNNQL